MVANKTGAAMDTDKPTLTDLTLEDAAAGIRGGYLTSQELVSACLAKIESRDTEIKAFAHVDPVRAMSAAEDADKIRATGNGVGPLHGVPIGVKDIIDTSDMPTENGSPIFSGRQPELDAPCVSALRDAGAIVIGKTVTTELALLNPAETKNPANLNHTPGGSSAGSAAAVAANMVPAALGSQTAGSVVRPASYCGVVGFKPTFGLISRRGIIPQSHTLDTVGVFTRTPSDAALLVDCLSAVDGEDPVSYPRSQPKLFEIANTAPPTKPIFGFVKTPVWDSDGTGELHQSFAELTLELGEHCEEIEPAGLDNIIEWQRIIQLAENAAYYGPIQEIARHNISDNLNGRLDEGRKVPVDDYIKAVAARDTAYQAISQFFSRYSAILTPAAPGPAPEGFSITGSPIFNGLWTYLGMPTVSLPLLASGDLPIGVQLVGLRRDDGRLLRTANWLIKHLANGSANN